MSAGSAPPTGEAALRRQYDQLLNGNLAGIFRTTLDGRFVECNDAMARMLGYAGKEELRALRAHTLYFAPEDRVRYISELRRHGRLENYEITLRHKSGRPVHVIENVYLDADGPEPTMLGMMIDITDRKRAEDEQRSLLAGFRGLVDRMRDGLLVVVAGRVRYANAAAAALVGRDPHHEPAEELFSDADRRAVHRLVEQAASGHVDEALCRMGDAELTVLSSPTVLEGAQAVLLVLQDNATRERLLRDRVQLRIAQEVNEVLRAEIEVHRRTQEELRRSRRFARSLVESSLDMIMAVDREGRITVYNPAASLRFGYEPDEAIGQDARILYADPAEHERVKAELDAHGVYAGEVRNRDKHGQEFTSYLAASRLFDEDGRVIGAMGVSRDITRMKRDQEALRASEERYRDLFENATDLIQSVRPDGRFEYVNEAWRRTLGYTSAELARLTVWDVVHPDHISACRAFFDRVMRGEDTGPIRTVLVSKQGRPVTVEGSTSLRTEQGRPIATRSIFRDITSVLAARRSLQEHEAKWRALFESGEHMLWSVDRELRVTSSNKGFDDLMRRLHGTASAPPCALPPPGAARGDWERSYREAFGGRSVRLEASGSRPEGRIWAELFLSPVFGPDGRVEEVFGIGHEITEQKRAQELAREQAARLKAIFESSANMMIWTLDRELRITSFNACFQRSIQRTHGIRLEIGDPFAERMAGRVAPGHVKPLLRRYSGALAGRPQQFEVELVDLDGEPAWVENFLNPIVVDGRVVEVSCLAYGITDRKQAQRALEQSLIEKEVLLKEVHHRVKNNLQVISSITKLQERREGLDPSVRELLHHSRDRIRSMALIHERLYQNKQFSSIDMADYIEGLARDLAMSYASEPHVRMELDLRPARLGIEQAMPCGLLLNELISNALKHAFPDQRPGLLRIALREEGANGIRIELSDDGLGLPEGFDEARDGGLGMELVRMLAGQLDARIERTSPGGVAYLITFERDNRKPHGADERLGR